MKKEIQIRWCPKHEAMLEHIKCFNCQSVLCAECYDICIWCGESIKVDLKRNENQNEINNHKEN